MEPWQRFNDYPGAVETISPQQQELIKTETAEYKKLLTIMALAVLAVVVVEHFMGMTAGVVFRAMKFDFDITFLRVIDFDFFARTITPDGVQAITGDSFFTANFIINAVIAYAPSLVIYGITLRKFMKVKCDSSMYSFYPLSVFVYFMAMNALFILSFWINDIIADFLSTVFGTGGHRDIFIGGAPANDYQWYVMFIFVGIVAAVVEEIIFRHMLLKPLRRYGDGLAVVVTAILFGFAHGNFTQLIYTTIGGILMGIVTVKANSIIPAIVIHALNNSFEVGRFYLRDLSWQGRIPLSFDGIHSLEQAIFAAGVLFAVVLIVKKKIRVKNDNPYIASAERARLAVQHPLILLTVIILTVVVVRGS
jgi:membrane protease YdiL (CAAX protease family)